MKPVEGVNMVTINQRDGSLIEKEIRSQDG